MSITTKTVTVMTFEPSIRGEGGVGGLDWHVDPAILEARFDAYANDPDMDGDTLALYTVEVDAQINGDELTEHLNDLLISNHPTIEPTRYRRGPNAATWTLVHGDTTHAFHSPVTAHAAYDALLADQRAASTDAPALELLQITYDEDSDDALTSLLRTNAEDEVTIRVPADVARLISEALTWQRAEAIPADDPAWAEGADPRAERANSHAGFMQLNEEAQAAVTAALTPRPARPAGTTRVAITATVTLDSDDAARVDHFRSEVTTQLANDLVYSFGEEEDLGGYNEIGAVIVGTPTVETAAV